MKKRTPEPSRKENIRVLVVDDHAIVRKGIRAVLELEPDIELVGEAGNGTAAVAGAQALKPDVILMDLLMPDMNGAEATRRIKAHSPAVSILVLTTFAEQELVLSAIKAGASGYQLKDSSPEVLLEAIRQVYRGEASLHPLVAREVLHELSAPPARPPKTDPLTPRELEVLRCLAQGYENREIAEKLVISEATVRTHVSNIIGKLHVASRTQAALYAIREGLAGETERQSK
jgi:two-component system, NarL family, response regulator LiaR